MKTALVQHGKPVKASVLLGRLNEDVRSLNSSILIITQKMKYVVRNEKILGRNLIVLNKKFKALEERIVTGQISVSGGSGSGASDEQVKGLERKLEDSSQRIAELEAKLQELVESAASKEELQEMHYVVDSINPLQFVTLDQAKDLVAGKKVKARKSKKKKKK